jgi:parallel beta-helix repeat protein
MDTFRNKDQLQLSGLRILSMLVILAVAIILVACSEDDEAGRPQGFSTADMFVDDDQRQCPAAAHSTIQEAVDAALPGQTIAVCEGLYTGTITIPADKNGLILLGAGSEPGQRTGDSSKEAVVLGSPNGQPGFAIHADESTIIGFTVLRTSRTGIELIAEENMVINGATISSNFLDTTGDPETAGTDCAGGRGLDVERAKDVIIEDNLMQYSCGAGIRLSSVTNSIVQRNTITGSRKRPGIAVRDGSSNNMIISNISNNNREAGISLQDSTDNLVQDNWMSNNGLPGIPLREIPGPGSNTDADDTTNLPLGNPPQNTWEGNVCATANRHGLCQP